ncbi:MAG: membrane protein insertase YidC [Bacteroidetes bacterium]|nr:membrane protein insertase YidC [Bacteroidota bacterium]
MDKNSLWGYLLIFLIFAGYLFYTSKNTADIRQQDAIKDSIEQAHVQDSLHQLQLNEATISADDSSVVDSNVLVQIDTVPEKLFTLSNEFVNLSLSSKGGRINSVELRKYQRSDSAYSPLILFQGEESKFDFTIPLKTGVISSSDLNFEVTQQDSNHIVLEHKFADGSSIAQSYSIRDKYMVDYHLLLNGLEKNIARKHNAFDLNWSVKAPLQERSLDAERNESTIYYKYLSEKGVDNISERKYQEQTLQANVQWVSFKQKFFMSAIIFPEGLEESGTTIETSEVSTNDYVKQFNSSFSIPYDFNKNYDRHFEFYFGPNHYQTLKKQQVGLEKTISLGWGIIGWVNKFLIIPVFNWLSNYFVSYGLIILFLTLIIKGLLILPMYKIYVSSAKMKLLKPDLDEIKERTGGDMQKMQSEQMKLYKQAGVSPFGGCLPQLIQFPILIAMFRFFPSSIELRHKSFLWAKDLSTYDSIFTFPNGFEIPWYGDHISLFTLLMAASSLLYTMYNSQSTGITGQMKYIMYLMPVMLLVWFNSYSSGLSYYYFLANMITFGQNFIFKTFIVDDAKLHKQIQDNKKKKVAVKKGRFQKRLEDMAKAQQKKAADYQKNQKRK